MKKKTANVHDANTHLSRLLRQAARGAEFVIALVARVGKPIARLVGIESKPPARTLGTAKGDFVVPDDFNAPLPDEILDGFDGKRSTEPRT